MIRIEYQPPGQDTLYIESNAKWSLEEVQRLATLIDEKVQGMDALRLTVDGLVRAGGL